MKKQALTFAVALLIAANTGAKTIPGTVQKVNQQQNTGIKFTENKGQVHDQNYHPRPDVLYSAMTGNMAVHVKNTGVSYQLYKANQNDTTKTILSPKAPFSFGRPMPKLFSKGRKDETGGNQLTVYRIDLTWLNACKNFTRSEDEALAGYNNYYLENCPDGILNVKSYKGITLNNLYKGINLHYYEKNGELKHDYIVAPHADYKQIQIQVEGAEINVNPDGSLILTTGLGKIQEGAPIVYQNAKQLKARWLIKNTIISQVLSFEIENYDPDFELLIDPVTRLWGTYYGGTGTDAAYACATDASGNVYMVGETNTATGLVIATTGSHQSTFSAYDDAYLIKFNGNGARQWGTYYGGTQDDYAQGCATDTSGNVYMAGTTSSTDNVIATPGSQQSVSIGGTNAFLVKFNSNGVRQWGTYYGAGGEYGRASATDVSGNVYMTGESYAQTTTLVATVGCHQPLKSTGYDAFLVKFNTNGVRQWGTYYGSIGSDDQGFSCATDASGNVYMAGATNSPTTTAIATPGSHQPTNGGNILDFDAFLVKFDGNGTRLWGTYYGGTLYDIGEDCSIDKAGNVYLAGATSSSIGVVIATPGSHQPAYGGGPTTTYENDAFLVKFDTNGVRQWGTYYGGIGMDIGFSCIADASGNVYLAGWTDSNTGTVIATNGSHQPNSGGDVDAFLVKFNANGIRQSATYYGGTGTEYLYSCAVDASDNVFVTGQTNSATGTVIATTGSHQSIIGGGDDAFLVKFACAAPPQPSAINGNTIICTGSGAYTYGIATIVDATSYTWALPVGWMVSGSNNTISAIPGTSGVFTVTANNACGISQPRTVNIIITACTGIKENGSEDFGIKVYPNPTNGIINLELESDNEVIMMNAVGQIVFNSQFGPGTHQINLESLAKGIYVVKVGDTSDSKNIKIIKE